MRKPFVWKEKNVKFWIFWILSICVLCIDQHTLDQRSVVKQERTSVGSNGVSKYSGSPRSISNNLHLGWSAINRSGMLSRAVPCLLTLYSVEFSILGWGWEIRGGGTGRWWKGLSTWNGRKWGRVVQDKGGDIELRDSNYNTYSLVGAARVIAIYMCFICILYTYIYIYVRDSRFGKDKFLIH